MIERSMPAWRFSAIFLLLFAQLCLAGLVSRPSGLDYRPSDSFTPPLVLQDSGCATRSGEAKALLIGSGNFSNFRESNFIGPANDVSLLKNALLNHSVRVVTSLDENRHDVVAKLQKAASDSHCGDTLFIFYSGHSTYVLGEFIFAMTDIDISDVGPTNDHPAAIPGSISLREFTEYFTRLRDNGINVFFAADSSESSEVATRQLGDMSVWKGGEEAPADRGIDDTRGAFFGIYMDEATDDREGEKTFGFLSFAMASVLGESGNKSFQRYAQDIVTVMRPKASKLGAHKLPIFEASDPQRSPFATGLGIRATQRSTLRGTETRRIEITVPALKRGLARVGLGNLLIQGRVVAPNNPKSISANQVPGRINPDGTFQISLPVTQGENKILLTAWWSETDFVPQFVTVLSQNGNDALVEGQRYALIIGNQDYQDPAFPSLGTPIADAKSIADLLSRRFGFQTSAENDGKPVTLVLLNAKRGDIVHAFSQLTKMVNPEDSVLVYYGGHGDYEQATDQSYWIPVDANRDEPGNWLSDREITASVARLRAKHVLVVADSCYAGAFRTRGTTEQPSPMTRVQFLDQETTRASRKLLTSGGKEPVADSGGRGHSIFAQALIDGLQRETKPVTAGELYVAIKGSVGGGSGQLPQYFPMRDGDDGGELVFVPSVSK